MMTMSVAKAKVYRRRSESCIYSSVAFSMSSHCFCVKLYQPGQGTNITEVGTV